MAFSLKGDWTKFPNAGQAAWPFCSGAIQTGAQPLEIPVSQSLRLQSGRQEDNGSIGPFLQSAVGYQQAVALEHPVRITPSETGTIPAAALATPPAVIDSDTAETTMDTTHNVFLIHATSAAGVLGFVGQTKYTAGALDVTLASSARGFVSMLLTPLDGRSLADSRDLLLSNPGYTLRSQPGTTPASPAKHSQLSGDDHLVDAGAGPILSQQALRLSGRREPAGLDGARGSDRDLPHERRAGDRVPARRHGQTPGGSLGSRCPKDVPGIPDPCASHRPDLLAMVRGGSNAAGAERAVVRFRAKGQRTQRGIAATKGRQAISVAPFRGFLLFCTLPTAYAVGYFLSPLRDSNWKGFFYKIIAAREDSAQRTTWLSRAIRRGFG